jgi:hypothetical protein
LEKAVKVDFHLHDVEHLLRTIFETKRNRVTRLNGAEMLVQIFAEEVARHPDNYPTVKSKRNARHAEYPPTGQIDGAKTTLAGRECVWIPMNRFQELLNRQTQYGADTAKRLLHQAGYLEKFGKAYYRWFNLGSWSANCYCLYLPQKIEQSTEIFDCSTDTSTDELPTPPPKMVVGLVRLTEQDIHMTINKPLAQALNLRDDSILWATTNKETGLLVLSKTKKGSEVPLMFAIQDGVFVSTSPYITYISEWLGIRVSPLNRLLLCDIRISVGEKGQLVIVNTRNPFGQRCGKLDEHAPYKTSDWYPEHSIKNSQRNLLLEDE